MTGLKAIFHTESNLQFSVILDPLNVVCDVPQGSILGPLLFIIYVNNIYQVSEKCSTILFADDTNIFFTGRNANLLKDIICQELKEFYTWFSANKFSLNISKTNFIVFDKTKGIVNNLPFDISIDWNYLKRVHNTTFLGVIIDSGLTWNNHVKAISTKIARGVGILSKIKHFYLNQFCVLYTSL